MKNCEVIELKWFKHLSKSLSDPVIFESIEKFGGDGYLVYFGTIELLSDEFDIYKPGVKHFSWKYLQKNLQTSRKKLTKIYTFFDEKAKENHTKIKSFFAEIDEDGVTITCHKLADLCDNHTQKILSENKKSLPSEEEASRARVIEERRENIEERREKKKELNKKKENPSVKIIFDHWNEQEIIKHRDMEKFRSNINSALKKYSEEEIVSAINNYSSVLHDDDSWWTHSWNLRNFLTRGLDRFCKDSFKYGEYVKIVGRKSPLDDDNLL